MNEKNEVDAVEDYLNENPLGLPEEIRTGVMMSAGAASLYFLCLIQGGMTRAEALHLVSVWLTEQMRSVIR